MILCQIGEQGRLEANARHPVLGEGVARNLHDDQVHPPLHHVIKEPKQVRGLGGGALGLHHLIAD